MSIINCSHDRLDGWRFPVPNTNFPACAGMGYFEECAITPKELIPFRGQIYNNYTCAYIFGTELRSIP